MRSSMMRRAASLTLALLLLLSPYVAGAFSYFPPEPRTPVGVARPTISQQILLGHAEEILAAQMWLDGARVRPAWDATGLVSYTPPQALGAGVHRVRLEVEVSAGTPGFFFEPLVQEFSFEVAAGAVSELPVPDPEQLRALERVNWYRTAAGLAPMRFAPELGASTARHAAYLAANDDQRHGDSHTEEPGTPLYFGASGGDRARYFAYQGGSAEVINFVDLAERAVDGWMDSLYHRIPFLKPGNTEMGYGLAGAGDNLVNVVQTGPGDATPGAVLWPQPGQTGVPTSWDGAESPDPFDLYPGAPRPVGYTITLTFGGQVRSLTLSAASLTGPAGAVKVYQFSPGQDPRLRETVAIIPAAPLAPGTTYTGYLAGQVDQGGGPQPYERRWSFTTRDEHPPMVRSRTTTYTEAGEVRRISIEGAGFRDGMQVYLGGLPVESLQVASGTSLSFRPPAGYTGGRADLVLATPGGQQVVWHTFYTGHETLRFGDGVAFTEVPLRVDGTNWKQPAILHRSGALLAPEGVLEALGARRTLVEPIARTYWAVGDRSGDYTLYHARATLKGAAFPLALPAQEWGGTVYVDTSFIKELTGGGLTAAPDLVTFMSVVEGMTDIGSHWARDAIVKLLRAGIVSGNGDGTFRPEDTLTRAAFVKMLAGARALPPQPGRSGGFADTGSHWVTRQGYLAAAVTAGIVQVKEYAGARFEPDRPITREEIAVMVARALGRAQQAAARSLTVTNGTLLLGGKLFVDAAAWTRAGYVAEAVDLGIVAGYAEAGGFSFRPLRQATRAEAAAMTLRMMQQ